MGVPANFQVDTALAFPDTSGPFPSEDSLVVAAQEQNPEFRSAADLVKVQRKQRLAALGQRLPILSANYSRGVFDTSIVAGVGGSPSMFWNLGINLKWDIFDGGQFIAILNKAGQQLKSSAASRDIARNSAAEQMRQAVANLRAAREGLRLIRDLVSSAEEDFRLQSEKNRLGAAAIVDVLNSQTRYVQARLRATQVIANYYLAQAQIERILGTW
jgi:outer membrane protein